MCLAIPACITNIGNDRLATVDILGAEREISLDLTPNAQVGDYVLVHAGFAIEVVDEQFAQETIDLIREFPDLAAEDIAIASGGVNGGAAEGKMGALTEVATEAIVDGATDGASNGASNETSNETTSSVDAGATANTGMTMQGALAELAKEL